MFDLAGNHGFSLKVTLGLLGAQSLSWRPSKVGDSAPWQIWAAKFVTVKGEVAVENEPKLKPDLVAQLEGVEWRKWRDSTGQSCPFGLLDCF